MIAGVEVQSEEQRLRHAEEIELAWDRNRQL